MDFTLDGTAQAVSDVATDLVGRHTPVWDEQFDAPGGLEVPLWSAMVESGVVALPLPEDRGGDTVGILGLLPLLTKLGESAGVTPAIGTLVAGLAIRESSSALDRLAETIVAGGHVAIAIGEPGAALTTAPHTSLSGRRLTGTKTAVLHADGAAALLVTTDSGIVLVDAAADGVSITRTPASSRWGEYTVRLENVAVDDAALVSRDGRALRDLYRLGLAAYADGILAGALRITADHVSNRNQFGKPIGTFQAVTQQIADIYVVGRSMNLAVTSAAWRLAEGLDADRDLSIATYWLAAEMPSTLRTMTHLHGGVGVDITYPLHRYYSIIKDLARIVGGATARLDELAESSMFADELADSTGQEY
ncbi:acyl-CoA dehydrogenase family protein [Williamsia phyllosphaerae]|uniref:Acyl-CoA dehydrogenase FadE n=1 Tax=Williamsia phyllosphaerae TaxID=885042 RepID=A0ABQ1U0T2_9NOCA|nr:acyl-CoA dehydrogenase family protein [Williamsia phyllosphaerae]GGF08546.1 putative acyl-CoA dehydrogenase FadE [Williamsia phyllosphaerae]